MKNIFFLACVVPLVIACTEQAGSGGRNPLVTSDASRSAGSTESCGAALQQELFYQLTTGETGGTQFRVPASAVDDCGRRLFSATSSMSVGLGEPASPHDGLSPGQNITPGSRFGHDVQVTDPWSVVGRGTACQVLPPADLTIPAGSFTNLIVTRCHDQRVDRPFGRTVTTWQDRSSRVIIKREYTILGGFPGRREEVLLEAPRPIRPQS
jgi:hypothetical protein